MNFKKLILPMKYIATILIGIASLGFLIYFVIGFVNVFDKISSDWSYIVDYVLYFLIFAATIFNAGRGIYLLMKGKDEKFNHSLRDSIFTYMLYGLWIAIDYISLFAETKATLHFPILPLITGIFAVITFVALLLVDVKKLESKKHIFNVIFAVSSFITGVLYVVNNALDVVMMVFSIVGLLAIVGFGIVTIYTAFFDKKEEAPVIEEQIEE